MCSIVAVQGLRFLTRTLHVFTQLPYLSLRLPTDCLALGPSFTSIQSVSLFFHDLIETFLHQSDQIVRTFVGMRGILPGILPWQTCVLRTPKAR